MHRLTWPETYAKQDVHQLRTAARHPRDAHSQDADARLRARYGIARHLEQLSSDVLTVGESSLYPALQRLLVNDWVTAEWGETELKRRARFYRITAAGRRRLAAEAAGFDRVVSAIVAIMQTG
jgi:PadR family transcriptional regulator, regulatory protein PadR